jgi:hypothetical protein
MKLTNYEKKIARNIYGDFKTESLMAIVQGGAKGLTLAAVNYVLSLRD